MRIAFYGSSLLSSFWNGAATYYRGILSNLASRGHSITFYEPDAYDRQKHRDIDPPEWAKVVVYEAKPEAVKAVIAEASRADVVVKASGVGVFDDVLLEGLMESASPDALRIFWDVDAPATLASMHLDEAHPVRRALSSIDLVLTYGGGTPVVRSYEAFGARACTPVYNALDPLTHHPVSRDERFDCDIAFLGNRLPDREERVEEFFFGPAGALADASFLIGGSGWETKSMPANVRSLGHVSTRDHNAFNVTPKMILNVARDSMAHVGFSPATRVFEAAGAEACIVTDAWEGIELFLEPEEEILVARDGQDVVQLMRSVDQTRARRIGQAARQRILREHTYAHRGQQVDEILRAYADRLKERSMA